MLKDIKTKEDYAEYEKRVAEFYDRENLVMLNNGPVYCFCGSKIDFDNDPWKCPECETDYETISEPSFSWRNCECCDRPLGGDRYIATGIIEDTDGEGLFEYSICSDCMYYIEYGRLDDMTMMEIED